MVEFSTVAKDLVLLCRAVVNHSYFSTIASVLVIPLHSGLQFDILRRSIAPQEPDLVYHGEDDCIWAVRYFGFTLTPNDVDGHRLPLPNSINGINVMCTVNGTELLDAIIFVRG